MPTPIPALSVPTSTRANIPCTLNTTTANVSKWFTWALKAALMDQHTTGQLSTAYARPAGSVWTCVKSSNGATVAASDLWGSTFDVTKIVKAANGVAHSWIHLTNGTHDCVIDCITASDINVRIAFARAGQFTSGGTLTTQAPFSAAAGWLLGNASADNGGSSTNVWGDLTTLGTHYFHFTCTATSFFFFTTRAGTALASCFSGFVTTTGNHPSDTYNSFAVYGSSTTTGRGAPTCANLRAGGAVLGRSPIDTVEGTLGFTFTTGGPTWVADGAAPSDVLSSEVYFLPLAVWTHGTMLRPRGTVPDFYEALGGYTGTSHPSVSAQTHFQLNCVLVPFLEFVPLM